jgi:hypothetical protein
MLGALARGALPTLAIAIQLPDVNRAEGTMNVNFTSESRHVSLVGCERGHVHRCCGGGIAGRFGYDQRKTILLLAGKSTLRPARSGRADTWRSGR